MGVKVLHFLVFLLALSCSGTSVRVSSGGGRLSSSPANHLPFLKRNGASHIGISDEDYRLLREICGKEKPLVEEFKQKELNHGEKRLPPSLHRELLYSASEYINGMAQSHIDTPASVPVINPMTPTTATPVVTPLTPSPPTTMTPITTPMTTPPASSGMTNPPPSGMTNPPASSGQSWCVASQSASETALQVALDYACGYGGADCSAIQKGGSCFNPDTLRDHASYAFNDYYQKNPAPTSCNFGGTAVLTNTDPSTSTCQYPSSSPTSSVINTTNPTGSTVFGPEPPGSFSAASSLQSWTIIVTLACLLMLLIAVDHL
ncbi:glucan endo-1,3-beta-glucosidase 12-like isoform X2 [Magnolia sinica]|uniref:glucan endo-1,3-beta-glucosidase 12-like isoform X2 n=1 Tax=Magnolia sinica TaxID=86752 RepID=UPI00265A4E8B|nr:glucan endo-1,3-beta-glucosidase 12-like isoform X2 [Magnolia sinica]